MCRTTLASRILLLLLCALLFTLCNVCFAWEYEAQLNLQTRYFTESPQFAQQKSNDWIVSFEPQWYHTGEKGENSLQFTPYIRKAKHDEERSVWDIRELLWTHNKQRWELSSGVSRVFWGVTESRHLVDIVNQTDLVNDFDRETKLGQAMVHGTLPFSSGSLEVLLLPGFRERNFPGQRGRLRPSLPIAGDDAVYESGAEQKHVDWAVRWSQSMADWELGSYYFEGTGRDPSFIVGQSEGELALLPYYYQIKQLGIDLQWAQGDNLWKLETIGQSGLNEHFWALVAGVEHTIVLDSGASVGLLAEYLYDSRQNEASRLAPTSLQNDSYLGLRYDFGDFNSTTLLAGVIIDNEEGGQIFRFEFERRFSDQVKLSIVQATVRELETQDPSSAFLRDDYIEVNIGYYF
jgi:hypothetical protein